jgi:hypothetical protein
MGIINNDSFEAGNGVQKSGTYISFNNETLYLRKSGSAPAPSPAPVDGSAPAPAPVQEALYSVNANYRIFWDKAAKDAGKSFMELRSVSAQIPESQLQGNLYVALYAELKKQYPNSVDE